MNGLAAVGPNHALVAHRGQPCRRESHTHRTVPRTARLAPFRNRRFMPGFVGEFAVRYRAADILASGVRPLGDRRPRDVASSVTSRVVSGRAADARTAIAAST